MSSSVCRLLLQKNCCTPITPMPDSWILDVKWCILSIRKTAAHPTHCTNARFLDIKRCMLQKTEKLLHTPTRCTKARSLDGCQVTYSTKQNKKCSTPNLSHQCQIPGCQATYSISTETPLRTQPVTPSASTRSSRPWPCAYRPSPLLHTPIRCTNAWFMDASSVFHRIRKNRNQCQNPRWMSWSDVFCKNRIFFSDTRDLSLPVEHSAV